MYHSVGIHKCLFNNENSLVLLPGELYKAQVEDH